MISKISSVLMSAFVIGQCSAWALADQKPQWKGTITKDGDIVVVNNPKKPQYSADIFSFEEDLAIGGQDSADFILGDITSVCLGENGAIYILDGKEKNVKVFGSDGKYLRTFGRAGDGPGEFKVPNRIYFTNKSEVLVVDIRRLSIFKPNGDHVRDVSAATLDLSDACPDSRGNFFAYLIVRDMSNPRYELRKIDSELKTLFVLDSSPLPNLARDGFNPVFPILRWSTLSGDKAVCGYAEKSELKIYDAKGQVVRKIVMNTDSPISISQKDIEERTKGVPPSILKNMKIPKYYPFFRYIATDDEDRIFVLTYERPSERKGYCFDVFDAEGRYIVRTVLPSLIPLIRKGHLYAIEESDEGYPVLKRYKIRWKL